MRAGTAGSVRAKGPELELSPAHYIQILLHRRWLVVISFVVALVLTAVVIQRLPNIYTSETVIMVDPQKVPESYVKATVSGDVRNRLGTLTQQILSTTRLQRIIDTFHLYPHERRTLPREDVIARMRKDINVAMVTGGGAQQSLEAFRITYSGRDPRLVAQVTNELASMFIEENLKVREQQATGTTEFLQHQLDDARKGLESQEAKLRDFRMQHVGEMPEHQVANLTVLGQLRASLQQEGEALSRAEQQRSYLQSMMAQSVPVVDMDSGDEPDFKPPTSARKQGKAAGPTSTLNEDKARLATLLTKYTEQHPEIQKLRQQIADREAKEAHADPAAADSAAANPTVAAPPVPVPPVRRRPVAPVASSNPVLLSQLKTVEVEIAKHQQEQQRLNKLVASYQAKLEAIPLREQQISELVRDYEINKAHYTQLLDKQLSAETATQLEIRQKGEQFSVLDPAQPAQRPSSPNRPLLMIVGSVGGLLLGVLLAIGPEFFGASITSPEQVPSQSGNQVLEIIPMILTETGARRKKKQLILAAVSGVAATIVSGAVLFYHYRR